MPIMTVGEVIRELEKYDKTLQCVIAAEGVIDEDIMITTQDNLVCVAEAYL